MPPSSQTLKGLPQPTHFLRVLWRMRDPPVQSTKSMRSTTSFLLARASCVVLGSLEIVKEEANPITFSEAIEAHTASHQAIASRGALILRLPDQGLHNIAAAC